MEFSDNIERLMVMKTTNEYYDELGQAILNWQMQKTWDRAQLLIAVVGRSVDMQLNFFEGGQESNVRIGDGVFETSCAILDLHKMMHENNMSKWNRAEYTLNSDRSFNMTFEWDQSIQDTLDEYKAKNS
jgi:hypothetical protein